MRMLIVLAQTERQGWFQALLDNALGLTILFIFLGAIVGAFVNARTRDRCLKKFNGYPVTVLRHNGWKAWGTLRLFSKGLLLRYREPVNRAGQPLRSSVVLYDVDLADLLCVFRFTDELDSGRLRSRQEQLDRMVHPGPFRRLLRRIRNILNTLRDAFVKAFSAVVGQLQKVRPTAVLTAGGGTITEVGATALTLAGNAYEPILEQHIGQAVLTELKLPGATTVLDLPGYLGEYSDKYLLIFNVPLLVRQQVTIGEQAEGVGLNGLVKVARYPGSLIFENHASLPVQVVGIQTTEGWIDHDLRIVAGGTASVEFAPIEGLVDRSVVGVTLQALRTCDMVMPRTAAAVRHASADASVASAAVQWHEPIGAKKA